MILQWCETAPFSLSLKNLLRITEKSMLKICGQLFSPVETLQKLPNLATLDRFPNILYNRGHLSSICSCLKVEQTIMQAMSMLTQAQHTHKKHMLISRLYLLVNIKAGYGQS